MNTGVDTARHMSPQETSLASPASSHWLCVGGGSAQQAGHRLRAGQDQTSEGPQRQPSRDSGRRRGGQGPVGLGTSVHCSLVSLRFVWKLAYPSDLYIPGGLGGEAVLSPQPLVNWHLQEEGRAGTRHSALSPLPAQAHSRPRRISPSRPPAGLWGVPQGEDNSLFPGASKIRVKGQASWAGWYPEAQSCSSSSQMPVRPCP